MLIPRTYSELMRGDTIVLEDEVLIRVAKIVKRRKTFTQIEDENQTRYVFKGLVFTTDVEPISRDLSI